MNFQAVQQANGQNVTMFGTFNEIGGVSLTQNKKQVCKCQLIDDNGEKHLVRLYGTMPGPALLGQRQQFTLSTYSGKTQQGQPYTGYSGFWNDKAQVAPQNTQQAPPQPAQGTNYQPPAPQGKKEPDWDAIDAIAEGKVRHGILCAMLQGGFSVDYLEVLRHTVFVMTGIDPDSVPNPDPSITNNPNYVGDDPPPTGDDNIPF